MDKVEQIFQEFGVTESTLTAGELQALDRDGYIIFSSVIDSEGLARLRAAFESRGQTDEPTAKKESGTRHVNDLADHDSAIEGVLTHPKILAAVHHVLRKEFRVGEIGGRDPQPGYGQQGLHADWTTRSKGEPFRIVTTIWLLDDFTSENGATRVVPGTHHLLHPPPKSFSNPSSRHPDEKIIVAGAGSVLVFNGHLWHSGTRNRSNRSRRVVQCIFVGRNELRFSRLQIKDPGRLSPAVRFLLAV